MTNQLGFTTVGRSSGRCGHEHTTVRQAEKCAALHDKRLVRLLGERSDRAVIDPSGQVVRLPAREIAQQADWLAACHRNQRIGWAP